VPVVTVAADVYAVRLPKPSGIVYLVRAERPALIDAGHADHADLLHEALRALGVAPDAIELVLLTHEHFDHAGGADRFPRAILCAGQVAANKLRHQDSEATFLERARTPDIWLPDRSLVELGGFQLRTIHTPGHTSGSVCYWEARRGLLFTGDTVFARGIPGDITVSGSKGDQVSSIERLIVLRPRLLLPGHGRVSEDPPADLEAALDRARERMGVAVPAG
jgi:glyoxylase-like metal-dependent hydrolase (beta-lactamase superfamily II)